MDSADTEATAILAYHNATMMDIDPRGLTNEIVFGAVWQIRAHKAVFRQRYPQGPYYAVVFVSLTPREGGRCMIGHVTFAKFDPIVTTRDYSPERRLQILERLEEAFGLLDKIYLTFFPENDPGQYWEPCLVQGPHGFFVFLQPSSPLFTDLWHCAEKLSSHVVCEQ
jgi:hypothetical protein